MQVTYNGLPLYYYVQDSAAGDANGQGVGGAWYVVNPAGEAVTAAGEDLPDY
jgi:predicted lipoprotein with Yx(FWY)xxD motif